MLIQDSTTPIVFFPRFTTIAGAQIFETAAMNVERYSKGWITVWRGTLLFGGATAGFGATIQESEDQQVWTPCAGTAPNADPGANAQTVIECPISNRWLRAVIEFSGDEPVVSCWLAGFLKSRAT